MCVSAQASFTAAGLLAAGSVYFLRKSEQPKRRLFACIPLLFALQQFTEAFVWLSLDTAAYSHLKIPSVFVFLIFAQVVWPVYVPLSVYRMEVDAKRRKALLVLLGAGMAFSAWLLYNLIAHPSEVSIYKSHLLYEMSYPLKLALPGSIAYFASTVIPLFVSTVSRIRLLAFVILASFIVSKIYFGETLISVWCMMAALSSICIYYILNAHPVSHSAVSNE
jgi:hypothetical protein